MGKNRVSMSTGRPTRHVRGVVALAAVAVLGLAACGGDDDAFDTGSTTGSGSGDASKTLTVGGANFTEALILQQLYGQLLTKAGYTIDYKTADNREIYAKSLVSGEIDVVPEYAATMAEFLNRQKNGPDAPAVSSADVTATVTALKPLAEAEGLSVFAVSQAANQNGFAIPKQVADANQITTLSQMAAFKKAIRLAADEECSNPERVFCKPGLEKTYGFQVTVDPLGFGSTTGKQAVVQGKDDVALTGTTDGTLEQLGLVLLEDDKKLQSADNVIPVVNTESAGTGEVSAALDKLSGVLTTDDLAQLNLQVDGERKKPEDVAKDYLTSKGLL
jgi:osmoprotectant transport system substrate-binding protein